MTGRGDVARGTYLEIDAPRRLVFSWSWDSAESGPATVASPTSTIEVTFTPTDDGTRLRLVHRGLPAGNRSGSEAGWTHYLPRLAIAATGRDPGPDPWAAPDTGPAEVARAIA